MKSQTWAQVADWNRALFQQCVSEARSVARLGRPEEVLRWAGVAGWFASRAGWFGELSSLDLETELIRVAGLLPVPRKAPVPRARQRWLHVLSEAYATLGHTNLCRRWIEYDQEVIHDLFLLDQKSPAPANLLSAIAGSGGEAVVLDATLPLLDRAIALREFAWQHADVVVLHTHPEEVIATTAFGIPGGPPVLLVNHADHAFWFGCSVADLVVDIRSSGMHWTNNLRGVNRSIVLPLPLPSTESESAIGHPDPKGEVRTELGIPKDAVVFLTVGSAAKFRPMQGLDFVKTAKEIIARCPESYLIAIGPRDRGAWREARKRSRGRIMPLGYKPNSMRFCRAADVYLEGFPVGSLTAFLEAAEAGLPGVRNPRQCVPPYASDSPGLEPFPQPKDPADYINMAVTLASDVNARKDLGQRMQFAVRSQHCDTHWLDRLQLVKQAIPDAHAVHLDFAPRVVESSITEWHLEFCWGGQARAARGRIALNLFTEAWKRTGSEPVMQPSLWANSAQDRKGLDGLGAGLARCRDAVSLWRLNRRIRAKGQRSRWLAHGSQALAKGHWDLARRSVYSCLGSSPFCISDIEWIKLFIKVHFGRVVAFKSKE